MKKTWRPEGWENPFEGLPGYPTMAGECVFEIIYESGADALLEALMQRGNSSGGRIFGEEEMVRGSGIWVFIPDAEVI